MPVSSVPKGKMYQWLLTLKYVQDTHAERTAEYVKHGLLAPDAPERIRDDLTDMVTFLSESYSDYMDWLGMTSPFIDQHKKATVAEESAI